MKSNELSFLEEISLHKVCEHGQLRAQLEHPRSHNNEHAHLNHKFICTKQCFGSGKKYYGSGSGSDLKIISRIRIRILLEIILYCFTEGYF